MLITVCTLLAMSSIASAGILDFMFPRVSKVRENRTQRGTAMFPSKGLRGGGCQGSGVGSTSFFSQGCHGGFTSQSSTTTTTTTTTHKTMSSSVGGKMVLPAPIEQKK